MKELIKTNIDESTKEGKLMLYALMNGNDAIQMKEVTDGTEIEIDAWCEYHLTKDEASEDGTFDEMDCTVIKDAQGVIYATRSASVKRCIDDLCGLFDGDIKGIKVKKVTGKAKSGNTFVSITPVL